jgi:DNA-binding response OmpR family regulator
MQSILVVEDEKDTNEAISQYLQYLGYKVISCYDGIEAVNKFREESIDIIILDIMLPGIDGMDVLKEIRKKDSTLPVLMLTAISEEDVQAQSFDNLADDYITKPFSMLILGKRVMALLRRTATETWNYKEINVDFSGYSVTKNGDSIDVTPREIDVLKILLKNKGLVLSREQILNTVWEENFEVTDRIVDVYIKNLRKKLGIDCIITVKGVGYKLEEANEKN